MPDPDYTALYSAIKDVSSIMRIFKSDEFILAHSMRLNERRGEVKLGAKDTRTKGNKTTSSMRQLTIF